MIVSRVVLKNWRNFRSVDVPMRERVFLTGPNASGKSNFLEVFRFLHDIVKQGGGLQYAVAERGGLSKVRCLAARKSPDVEDVEIEVHLADDANSTAKWRYALGIQQASKGNRQPTLSYERVWRDGVMILERPDDDDRRDELRLSETHLEQTLANAEFRDIVRFFESILYLHLVPQLTRNPQAYSGPGVPGDPYGRNFLERVTRTSERTRKSRLRKIESALRLAVPQYKELSITRDNSGVPHLEANYEHWRPHGANQREDQFSDGTLRLIGLLWALLDGESLLLLEEPELSLNMGIVQRLPALMYRLQQKKKRQIIISTHSFELLSDRGLSGEEVLLLKPGPEGTEVEISSSKQEIRDLLAGGLSIAEAVLPHTLAPGIEQLELFR